MKISYIRVSSNDQLTIRQELIMEELGVEKVYIEKVSGKNVEERPQLKEMLGYVREGDELIVESISRIARNTKDLLDIVEQLKEKKVKFVSKKEDIDTSTASGKFMLTVFGAMAELEREYIRERQEEGIKAMPINEEGKKYSLRTGRTMGRQKVEYPSNWEEVYTQWKNGEIKGVQAMELLKLKKTTFYKLVKEYEQQNKVVEVVHEVVEKQCKECGEVKAVSKFRVNNRNKDGLDTLCKSCRRAKDEISRCKKIQERGWY